MRLLVLAIFILFHSLVKAEWICTKSSGYRSGDDVIYVCGRGIHYDEARSKILAFQNAYQEFKEICSRSLDCRNQEIRVTSHRSDCEAQNGQYKCLRMIEFEILDNTKEVGSNEYSPDFDQSKVTEESVEWNQVTITDLANYSFNAGFIGRTATTKEYKEISGSGLYLGISKRFLRFVGVEIAGNFGRGENSDKTPTTYDFSEFSVGTPFYYSWSTNELFLKPTYYRLDSSFEKNNHKIQNQTQTGYGLELGYTRFFYFMDGDKYYLGINPKMGAVQFSDSKDLKAQNPSFYAVLALTIGFR